MTIGVSTAVGVSALFNVFRFGSPLNEYYLQPKFRVHDLSTSAELFTGLLVAKNGGLLLFWTSAAVLLGLTGVVAVRSQGTTRLKAIAVFAIFILFTASLATWWMPFGWHAWGPRLTIAWIPALVLLAVVACGESIGPLVYRTIRSNSGLIVVALFLTVTALPQVGNLWNSGPIHDQFFRPDAYCTDAITLASLETPEGLEDHYQCVRFRAWEKSSILLSATRSFESFAPLTFAAVWAAAIVALLYLMRLELRPDDPTPERA